METLEAFGVFAVTVMVTSYALEKRAPVFIAVFALGCALAAMYAFFIESYPFMVAEGFWSLIAFRRWWTTKMVTSGQEVRRHKPSS